MNGEERRLPIGPFVILGAVVIGVFLGTSRPGNGVGAMIASGCLFLGVLISPRWLHMPIAVVAFIALSFALTARSMNGLEFSPLSEPVRNRSSGTLVGAVVGDPDVSLFSTQVVVRAEGWLENPKRQVDDAVA
ncbi:MAG: hypothetical protein F2736_05660, partial [Actinobacteria bacterium]|nr:hypothetical protein [Actinomycetota bacterium]